MSDLKSATKYFLFSINCVTFICGLILLFLGVVLQTQYASYFDFLDNSFFHISVWCIIMGIVVCLVSFLGLYGSIKEDHCSLLAFSISLGIIIGFEFAMGVSAFALANEDQLAYSIGKKMKSSLNGYDEPDKEGVTKVWDILQTDFRCCGVEFPGDWAMTPWARNSDRRGSELPDSCCSSLPFGETCSASYELHHETGCLQALEASSKKNAGILGAVACVVGFGQILLVVAACQLMKSTKKSSSCPPCF